MNRAGGSGDAGFAAGGGVERWIAGPIQNLGGQLRGLPGLDHETRIRFADEPCRFRIRRPYKKARPPGGEDAIDFARNHQAAEIRTHRHQMSIGRREAFRELVSGL